MDRNLFLDELKERIAEAKKGIEEAKKEIETAEKAGIDMSKEREELRNQIAQINRIESVYFSTKKEKK